MRWPSPEISDRPSVFRFEKWPATFSTYRLNGTIVTTKPKPIPTERPR